MGSLQRDAEQHLLLLVPSGKSLQTMLPYALSMNVLQSKQYLSVQIIVNAINFYYLKR